MIWNLFAYKREEKVVIPLAWPIRSCTCGWNRWVYPETYICEVTRRDKCKEHVTYLWSWSWPVGVVFGRQETWRCLQSGSCNEVVEGSATKKSITYSIHQILQISPPNRDNFHIFQTMFHRAWQFYYTYINQQFC